MNSKGILEALDNGRFVEGFIRPTTTVGPSAIISVNLEWSSRFERGRLAFDNGDYRGAAFIFSELDKLLPNTDRFLTPAKINQTFCWLRRGQFVEYIRFY